MGFLLDTNIISELKRRRPEPRVADWITAVDEDLLFISVLTLGEIRKGITRVHDAGRRLELEAFLNDDILTRFQGRVLPVDVAVADRWGRIAAQLTPQALPVIDALLAATALHHNLTLVTRNTRDVERTGVSILNPWLV